VEQISATAKTLSHSTKLRVRSIVGGEKQGLQRRGLDGGPVDILVATPGRLGLFMEQNHVFLSDTRFLVLDEVDTLADPSQGFTEELSRVTRALGRKMQTEAARALDPAAASSVQVISVGATVSPSTPRKLQALFPAALAEAFHVISPANSLSSPPNLRHRFVRVGGEPTAKHEALRRLLEELGVPRGTAESFDPAPASVPSFSSQLLIFCNDISCARSTSHFLAESGYSSTSLHGGIPPILRAQEFRTFAQHKVPILVCTDAAARGLDFPHLATVVQFDFPHTVTDYVHRAGRTARAGRAGTCLSLVAKSDVVLAQRIRDAVAKRESLQGLHGRRELEGATGAATRAATSAKKPYTAKAPGREDRRASRRLRIE
jgi:superfamily II DNA/RNA helicase